MPDFPKENPRGLFSPQIYGWMKDKQFEKYADLFPKISKYLKKDFSVLDIGIGKAWFEEFLEGRGIKFSRIVGIDVDEAMLDRTKKNIEYHLLPGCVDGKFDFVICFDTVHLLKGPEEIFRYAKQDGLILISLPKKWKELLQPFKHHPILAEGEIGGGEKDCFLLMKSNFFTG